MTASPTRSPRRVPLRLPTLVEVIGLLAFIVVIAPLIVVAGAALNADRMSFPPENWTFDWMIQALMQRDFMSGAFISFLLASSAALTATAFALPIVLLLRKANPAVARIVSLSFLGPLIVPSVIFALALYQVMILLIGSGNFLGLFIGHVIITLPFPIRTISAVSEGLDPALEDAASSVGSRPFQTFWHVTLPTIKTGVLGGFLFAFITSWNDFSVSIFLAPNQALPLSIQIFEYLQYEYRPVIAAIATWSVLGSAVLVYMIDRLVGLNVFMGNRR